VILVDELFWLLICWYNLENKREINKLYFSIAAQDLVGSYSPSGLPSSTTVSVTSAAGSASPAASAASPHPTTSNTITPTNSKNKKPPMRVKRQLRPLEAQSVINIGGIKYLVVPQPHANSASAVQAKLSAAGGEERLPILLKPSTPSDDFPTFEIRETSDGQLLLTQLPNNEKPQPLKNVLKTITGDSAVSFN
jgi:hypothetical protein